MKTQFFPTATGISCLPFMLCALLVPAFQLTAQPPVGINLALYRDWSPEFLFKDAFKSSRQWTAVHSILGNDIANTTIPLRIEDGYPLTLPLADTIVARTYLFNNPPHGYPAGNYRVLTDGTGEIRIRMASVAGSSATITSPASTTYFADGVHAIIVEIRQSSSADPVRNIRFVMPGFESDFETQPFYPPLLDFLTSFECIRWMDLMSTNNSPVITWEQRPTVPYYSQALANGVAYEHLIDLCNTSQTNAWVNIPHQANDDFIVRFATLLHDNLDPALRVYVEYSNEVWNGIFDQSDYALTQANANPAVYPGSNGEKVRRFYAKRSADVFAIFDSVFAGAGNRLVKVLGGQSTNLFGTGVVLRAFNNPLYNPNDVKADAFAIAPYFGNFIGQQICDANTAGTITVPEILQLADVSLPAVFSNVQSQKDSATAYGLMLIAYESGQHLENGNGGVCDNNATLTQKLTDANRDAGMGDLYCKYFTSWYETTNSLLMVYNSHSAYNQHGSWGLKEYMEQPEVSAPKFMALQECVIIPVDDINQPETPALFQISPNPAFENVHFLSLTGARLHSAEIIDLNGRTVAYTTFPIVLNLTILPAGVYFCRLTSENQIVEVHRIIKQ